MANGIPPPGRRVGPIEAQQQASIQRTRTTIQHIFGVDVVDLEDGGRQVDVVFPDNSVLPLPMPPEMAKTLGERLIAPSVEVARPSLVH
jgi:hypothetical protein